MTAHLYFVAPGALSDDMAPGAPVVLAGDEGRHAVTVKRMGVGEQILLADGEGLVAHAVVAETTKGELTAHVREVTRLLDGVPEHLRGTYAGMAHPVTIEHLQRLGVTTVELLPVHAFADEPHLVELGLTNHWGYNTLGFFAPHAAYSASGSGGGQVTEFKTMVKALHAAGIDPQARAEQLPVTDFVHLANTLS